VFSLPRRYAEEIVAHAREEAPKECCGILAGKNEEVLRVYRARNAEESGYFYSIDATDLYRIYSDTQALGWDFIAIYHSHPAAEPFPSQVDIAQASWTGPRETIDLWPGVLYIIVSLMAEEPVTRAFRIEQGQAVEVPLQIMD
jgi:proteasome lid subunit RPN8/RPN11